MSNTRAPVDVQEQPCHAAPLGRMRPKRGRRATHLLPEHETALANGHFSFAAVRTSARDFRQHRRAFSRRFVLVLLMEAAGIEPASVVRTG